MFRKVIFWTHLIAGITAALVVFMMSLTGVVLMYENQIIQWAEKNDHSIPQEGAERLPLNEFLVLAKEYAPKTNPNTVTVENDPSAPVAVGLSRGRNVYFNGYTGELLGEGNSAVRGFFRTITGWHRWFNLEGESRSIGRAITGAANLLFLFLVLSGMYLWLPKILKWPFFKSVLVFGRHPGNSKARDFNWHNVLGIWSAIPLIIVIATATVFYYPWANNLVYYAVGEEPPGQSERAAGPGGNRGNNPLPSGNTMTPDALFSIAAGYLDEWRSISVRIPPRPVTAMTFTLDQGNGREPSKRHELTLNPMNGDVVKWAPYESMNPGRKLRIYIRYLHTGEALGFVGQTVAGLVSLTSLIMIYTGLALAYRRLILER